MPALPYRIFQARHPQWDGDYWRKARALYAGGKKLLSDRELLEQIFPRHLSEEKVVYEERLSRAYYIPYAGEICDAILAALFDDTLTIEPMPNAAYLRLFNNSTRPKSATGRPKRGKSFQHVLRKQILTAMLCQTAWTQVDLPRANSDLDAQPVSLLDEEKSGLRDPYLVCIDPEMVIDWEENDEGDLLWVLIMHKSRRRLSLFDQRDEIEECYTQYTGESWSRWEIRYKADETPGEETLVEPVAEDVPHSFGCVPFARLTLPDGLYVMGKIIDIAIAHFNKRNALTWAELKSLFPVLVSFKQPPDPLNPITEDTNRDINQIYGPGRVVGFAEKDDLRYVGPDTGPFTQAAADLNNLRDEMHRVLHHMALSVDNSAAALQRSADSKQVDRATQKVVLRAFGQYAREHAIDLFGLAAAGRGEEYEFAAEGMDTYDDESVDGLLAQAEVLDTLQIPSPTFKRLWSFEVARRVLGDAATQQELDKIKEELEERIEDEMDNAFTLRQAAFNPLTGMPQVEDSTEEDEEENGSEEA